QGQGEERLTAVRLSLIHESGMVEDVEIQAMRRCSSLPYVMPPRSSFEVDFKVSVNGLISYNELKGGASELRIKEYFATVDFEVGASVYSDRISVRFA